MPEVAFPVRHSPASGRFLPAGGAEGESTPRAQVRREKREAKAAAKVLTLTPGWSAMNPTAQAALAPAVNHAAVSVAALFPGAHFVVDGLFSKKDQRRLRDSWAATEAAQRVNGQAPIHLNRQFGEEVGRGGKYNREWALERVAASHERGWIGGGTLDWVVAHEMGHGVLTELGDLKIAPRHGTLPDTRAVMRGSPEARIILASAYEAQSVASEAKRVGRKAASAAGHGEEGVNGGQWPAWSGYGRTDSQEAVAEAIAHVALGGRDPGAVAVVKYLGGVIPGEAVTAGAGFPVKHSPATGRFLPASGVEGGKPRSQVRAERKAARDKAKGHVAFGPSWESNDLNNGGGFIFGDDAARKAATDAATAAATNVQALFTTPLPFQVELGRTGAPFADAVTNLATKVTTLAVNEWANSDSQAELSARSVEAEATGWDLPKTGSMQGIIAHEFGHTATAEILGGKPPPGPETSNAVQNWGWVVRQRGYDIAKQAIGDESKLDGYARTDPLEAIAEAVSHVSVGGTEPWAVAVVKGLQDAEREHVSDRPTVRVFPVQHSPATGRFLGADGEEEGLSRAEKRDKAKGRDFHAAEDDGLPFDQAFRDPEALKTVTAAANEAIGKVRSVFPGRDLHFTLKVGYPGSPDAIAATHFFGGDPVVLNPGDFASTPDLERTGAKLKQEEADGFGTLGSGSIAGVLTHEFGHAAAHQIIAGDKTFFRGTAVNKGVVAIVTADPEWQRKVGAFSDYGQYSPAEALAEAICHVANGGTDPFAVHLVDALRNYDSPGGTQEHSAFPVKHSPATGRFLRGDGGESPVPRAQQREAKRAAKAAGVSVSHGPGWGEAGIAPDAAQAIDHAAMKAATAVAALFPDLGELPVTLDGLIERDPLGDNSATAIAHVAMGGRDPGAVAVVKFLGGVIPGEAHTASVELTDALGDYCGEGWRAMNNLLRKGRAWLNKARVGRRAAQIDHSLEPLVVEEVVSRCGDARFLELLDRMEPGQAFTDAGFVSAKPYQDTENVTVVVPAGVRASWLTDELLIGSGATFVVTGARQLEVVGQAPPFDGRMAMTSVARGDKAADRFTWTAGDVSWLDHADGMRFATVESLPVVQEGLVSEQRFKGVERAAQRMFAVLRNRVAKRLKAQRPASTGDWMSFESIGAYLAARQAFVENPDVLGDNFIELAMGDFLDELNDVVLDASTGAKIAIGFDVPDPAIERIIGTHLAAINQYGLDLRSRIGSWITDAMQQGLGVDDMVDQLDTNSPLSAASAMRWARTESVAAANGSVQASWLAADIGGFKRWLSARDSRVRDDHVMADGQTVRVTDKFEVCDGELADYPGDPALSPGCRINCRCVPIYVTESGDERTIPVTSDDLQSLAKLRGLDDGGTNAQLRRRLLNQLRAGENEAGVALEDLTRRELLERASLIELPGRAKMPKDDLIAALRAKGALANKPWEWADRPDCAGQEGAFPVRHDPATGRYLPSDGGGGQPRARVRAVRRATTKAAKAAGFDSVQLQERFSGEATEAQRKVQAVFPDVAVDAEVNLKLGITDQMHGVYAITDGPDKRTGAFAIRFTPDVGGTAGRRDVEKHLREDDKAGFHAPGTASVAGILAHEYGHVVAGTIAARGASRDRTITQANRDERDLAYKAVHAARKVDDLWPDGFSSYAASDDEEAVAEAIAHVAMGGTNRGAIAVVLSLGGKVPVLPGQGELFAVRVEQAQIARNAHRVGRLDRRLQAVARAQRIAGAFPVRHSPATGRFLPASGAEGGKPRSQVRAERKAAKDAAKTSATAGTLTVTYPPSGEFTDKAGEVAFRGLVDKSTAAVGALFPNVDTTVKTELHDLTESGPGVNARTYFDGSYIQFNSRDFAGTAEQAQLTQRYKDEPKGAHPVGADNPVGVVAHELGHAVFDRIAAPEELRTYQETNGDKQAFMVARQERAHEAVEAARHAAGDQWPTGFSMYAEISNLEAIGDAIAHVALGGTDRGAIALVRNLGGVVHEEGTLFSGFPVRHSPATGRFLPESGAEGGKPRAQVRAERRAVRTTDVGGHPNLATASQLEREIGAITEHDDTLHGYEVIPRVEPSGTDSPGEKYAITGEIRDRQTGESVGLFQRQLVQYADGTVHVNNEELTIRRDYQGQGIGTAVTAHLTELYARHGAVAEHLVANIDVGGYAWARTGYNWDPSASWEDNEASAHWILSEMKVKVASAARRDDAARKAQPAMLAHIDQWKAQVDDARGDVSKYPTAFEFSEFGHQRGMTTWPGKEAMLGSTWYGVRPIRQTADTGALVGAAFDDDPLSVRATLNEVHTAWSQAWADKVPLVDRGPDSDIALWNVDGGDSAEANDDFILRIADLLEWPETEFSAFPVRHDPATGRYLPSGGGGGTPRAQQRAERRAERADSLSQNTRNGELTPERRALHEQIIAGLLGDAPRSDHPTVLFLGGGPASGKSTLVQQEGATGVVIDNDHVKTELPEYQEGVQAGDAGAAAHVHRESSLIIREATDEAIKRGIDFTLDGTGDSAIDKLQRKVNSARSKGYAVNAMYVTVDTDEALRRAAVRGKETGRVVPPSVIREVHRGVTETFQEAIKRDLFDQVELWDNNASTPTLIGSKETGGTWTVHDEGAWQRFLAKAA